MQFTEVPGNKNNHKVTLYALSTCVWCKLIKQFLNNNDVAFRFVDVDLQNEADKSVVIKDILSKGGTITYPTTIIDDEKLLQGYRVDYMKILLEA
jgi:glutaredoxin-like protein NrdH